MLLFFHKIKITPDWRELYPVYLSMLQNSVYRALRVVIMGSNLQLQGRNPDATGIVCVCVYVCVYVCVCGWVGVDVLCVLCSYIVCALFQGAFAFRTYVL